jgi:hypothetical protein
MRTWLYLVIVSSVLAGCSPKQKPKEILFEYTGDICIHAMIDDTIPGTFIFDTGAHGLLIDSAFNENSGLKWGLPPYYDPPGTGPVITYKLKFAAGTCSYNPESIYIVQTKPTFGKKIDGVVGWDWLKDQVVKIDYKRGIMTVISPGDFTPEDSYTKIPSRMMGHYFMINANTQLTKECALKGEYVFDTGCGPSVILNGQTTHKENLERVVKNKCDVEIDWGVVARQHSSEFLTRAKFIHVNGFEIKDLIVNCSKDRTGILSSNQYVGLMGNKMWERFDVIIDFPLKNIYLKPNADFSKKMVYWTAGAGMVDRTDICEGGLVMSIYKGTCADSVGVRSGDIVTHVDGVSMIGINEAGLKKVFPNEDRDPIYTIKRDTSTMKIKLRRREILKE